MDNQKEKARSGPLAKQIFQIGLTGLESDIKLRFCELFRQASDKDLAQYLNEIILDKTNRDLNITFTFRQN